MSVKRLRSMQSGLFRPNADRALGDAAVFLVVVLAFLSLCRPLYDNSLLTHLQTGRMIIETRHVPTHDPYSYTAFGQPWTVQSWFASLLYGATERFVGLRGVVFLHGIVAAIIATLLCSFSWKKPLALKVLAGALPMLMLGLSWSARPLLFGVLTFAAMLVVVHRRASPIWMVPIMWLWVNTHGSFFMAPVVLVLMAIGAWFDTSHATRRVAREYGKYIGGVMAGILFGALNPTGFRMVSFPFDAMTSHAHNLANMLEWQSPSFGDVFSVIPWLIAVGVLCVAVAARLPWRFTFPFVVIFMFALYSQRNMVLLGVLAAPLLSALPIAHSQSPNSFRQHKIAIAIGMCGVAFVVLAIAKTVLSPATQFDGYPVKAVAALHERWQNDPPMRIVHQDIVGNYITFASRGDHKVFVDDRVDMFPQTLSNDYLSLVRGKQNAPDVLEKYKTTYVLWKKTTWMASYLRKSPEWNVFYEDDDWVVFERLSR